ncbi:MAG TPA: PASTA domain-containing protein [Gemmatimonadales bacterium]|jgi:serine/threonine-protein kinase|nr:PASTA domain-containing protein [Gemmatimonadales bacterium]
MRTRRHTGPAFSFGPGTPLRRFLRDLGLVTLTFVVGYGVSALWISPGSVIGTDHPIPRVLGLPEAAARAKLAGLGFRPRIEEERPSDTSPRGTVLWQDPPPEMVLAPNSNVELVLSGGPAPATVPDVIGFALPDAEKVFDAAGVKVGRIDTVRAGPEAGVVIATRPGVGSGQPRGAAVDLVVSAAAPTGGGL